MVQFRKGPANRIWNVGDVYWNRLGAERHARWCERDGLKPLPTRLSHEIKYLPVGEREKL